MLARDLPNDHLHGTPRPLSDYVQRLDDRVQVAQRAGVAPLRPCTNPEDFEMPEVSVPSSLPLAPVDRERIVKHLIAAGIKPMPVPPQVLIDPDDWLLGRQLRNLVASGSLEDALQLVGRLAASFLPHKAFVLKRVGQGRSGATVFHIDDADGQGISHALKLSTRDALWKLQTEVRSHQEATKRVEEFAPFHQHLPRLVQCQGPANWDHEGHDHIAHYGEWYALCTQFVGSQKDGRNEPVFDLEQVLTLSSAELRRDMINFHADYARLDFAAKDIHDARENIFRLGFLDRLCQNWFSRVGDDVRQIWRTSDAPGQAYTTFPPYCMTAQTKGHLLDFVDGQEARAGKRFFPDVGWDVLRDLIRGFLTDTNSKAMRKCYAERLVCLACVHGDLNANNVFVWLGHPAHPFLIDFPYFQDPGHVMQDFALLEATIKFATMDRQDNGIEDDPPALDWTHSQVGLWREMEDHLLEPAWDDAKDVWTAPGQTRDTSFSLGLVQTIRQRAKDLRKNMPDQSETAFLWEYLPALLYHTLYAISNPRLSVFKRLYAIYSAGRNHSAA